MPGFAMDSSAKGTSLSTTTARFIGTFSAVDGVPCITRSVSARAGAQRRASPARPPEIRPSRESGCSCDLPFRSRLDPGLVCPYLQAKDAAAPVFLQESNSWKRFDVANVPRSRKSCRNANGAPPDAVAARSTCVISSCRGSAFRSRRRPCGSCTVQTRSSSTTSGAASGCDAREAPCCRRRWLRRSIVIPCRPATGTAGRWPGPGPGAPPAAG